jgi:hypothetical protein
MRSRRTTVTFHNPFLIAGVDETLPAGSYVVVVEEEQITGVSFEAWRRTETSLRTPAIGHDTGIEQVIVIDPQALEDALAADAASAT